jgi:hypothetical protein
MWQFCEQLPYNMPGAKLLTLILKDIGLVKGKIEINKINIRI